MQPMAIILLLELAVKPRAFEAGIHDGKTIEDAGEEFFEGEWIWGRGTQGVEGDGGGFVGGVEADADYA